jgi:hypothetical protein
MQDENGTMSGAEAERILARGQTSEINPDTGLPIGLKAVSKPPKKNCKKCYGRGHIGWIDGDKAKPYPCMCTIEITLDLPEPEPEKTATEPVGGEVPKESPVTTTDVVPSLGCGFDDCTAMGDPKPESTELT